MERIPVFLPHIDQDTKKQIGNTLDLGWLGMGAITKEFEKKISDYLTLKKRYVVSTNTGTSALHIALLAADIGPGDEVITPSFNYVADHQAIHMTGATVVMCDIQENDLGLDVKKAEKLINKKTKAILPLHFAGIPCNMKGINALSKKFGLRIIEDACHSFGTKINNKKIGSFGDITCFSFDPVKIITSIDGGCVIVNTKDELKKLQHLRLLGVDKDTDTRYKNSRSWNYDVVDEGFRYHLTNVMASVGISQINQVDKFIKSRQAVCKKYNISFNRISDLKIPNSDFSNISPFIYFLRVLNGKRDALISHLSTLGIDTGIHFIPVHRHSFFKNSKCSEMNITEKISKEILTIPLHTNMKPSFVNRVIKGVSSFFK